MTTSRLAGGMVWLVAPLVASAGLAAEFQVDDQTLLLSHFERGPRVADWAMGPAEFAGSGQTLSDGYYGRGIDLRGLALPDDYVDTATGRLPFPCWFGIWPKGNLNVTQGTYEFWFRVAPADQPQHWMYRTFLFTFYHRATDTKGSHGLLMPSLLDYRFVTLGGELVEGKVPFSPALNPDDWHHFALCWSPGEVALYLDGRCVGAHDLSGQHGLALCAQPHRPLGLCGLAIDELRISDSVRYAGDFEPGWKDGRRPPYAFPGVPGVQRFAARATPAWRPAERAAERGEELTADLGRFSLAVDKRTGGLTGLGWQSPPVRHAAQGVLLWEGLERRPLTAARAARVEAGDGRLSVTQTVAEAVELRHSVTARGDALDWTVRFRNVSDRELWLEALLGLPLPPGMTAEYFDMAATHADLSRPYRRDEYIFSLPLAAVSGDGRFLGAGIDPHQGVSSLVSEAVPGPDGLTVRQGTRLVLSPKEEHELHFVVVAGVSDSGVIDAVDGYQALSPDLYYHEPGVPIQSYMAISRYKEQYDLPDLWRTAYTANQWGHGPGLGKGDEWGTQRLWDVVAGSDSTRDDYAYTRRLMKMWGSVPGIHDQHRTRNKLAYDTAYALRRSHYVPNWAMRFVVETLWPEGMVGGDPLVAGQYYPQMYYANEFQTPLGEHYRWTTRQIMDHCGQWSPGFINDMCHTSPMRFTDAVARKTPGRAFSPDRGVYLVGAFGHVDRYREIRAHRDPRGFQQTIWSDGGVVSYALLANSAAAAIESFIVPEDVGGPEQSYAHARLMLGEKPMVLHYVPESDYLGMYFPPDRFTPAALRDYQRYVGAQLMLCAIRHGIHVTFDTVLGRQWLMEVNPILAESLIPGRKTVPAATADPRLFVVRSGNGADSFLVIGNEQPRPVTGDVVLLNRRFGGVPVFGAYFSGVVEQRIEDDGRRTRLPDVGVARRDVVALKGLALLHGGADGRVKSSFQGDGLTMSADLELDCRQPAELELNTFAPLYAVTSVTLDGREAAGARVRVPAGQHKLAVRWRAPALDFDAATWRAVELIKDGRPNFRLAGPDTPFDRGTVGMLNQFLAQYDVEDGQLGNLPQAEVATEPAAGDGWQVTVVTNAAVTPSRVRIDPARREIRIEGGSPGEARRAMVAFLRLVDRKYPHIAGIFPLQYYQGDTPWTKLRRQQTKEFFEQFADPKFLVKPVLNPDLEHLYDGGNLDFTGKYTLRAAPYLYEPTYGDDYVHGYRGEE